MLVRDIMQGITPNPDYVGISMTDDTVLALNFTGDPLASILDYTVAANGVEGISPTISSDTQNYQFLHNGKVSYKSNTQRLFSLTGIRFIGEPFHDYCFKHDIKFGTGQAVVTQYTMFSMLDGKGEKGEASIIVKSDGGNTAGNGASIEVDISAIGIPSEMFYIDETTTPNKFNNSLD